MRDAGGVDRIKAGTEIRQLDSGNTSGESQEDYLAEGMEGMRSREDLKMSPRAE